MQPADNIKINLYLHIGRRKFYLDLVDTTCRCQPTVAYYPAIVVAANHKHLGIPHSSAIGYLGLPVLIGSKIRFRQPKQGVDRAFLIIGTEHRHTVNNIGISQRGIDRCKSNRIYPRRKC